MGKFNYARAILKDLRALNKFDTDHGTRKYQAGNSSRCVRLLGKLLGESKRRSDKP